MLIFLKVACAEWASFLIFKIVTYQNIQIAEAQSL